MLCAFISLAFTPSPPSPSPSSSTGPSASAAPGIRFTIPSKINGLARTKDVKRLAIPEDKTEFLKYKVLRPTDTMTAVYLNPDVEFEAVEVSAAAGPVGAPAATLRLITQDQVHDLKEVRPIDVGVAGAAATPMRRITNTGWKRDVRSPPRRTVGGTTAQRQRNGIS